jgi:replicative DNA helicase
VINYSPSILSRGGEAAPLDIELMKGLPANLDAERFVLGSVLLDDTRFISVAAQLEVEDFALEKHRRIYRRMCEISTRGEKIDRVTVANELLRYSELESVDGLSYLVSLDDGLPYIANLESYTSIVKQKSMLRRIAINAQLTLTRALLAEDDPSQILADANAALLEIARDDSRSGPATAAEIIDAFPGGINNMLDPTKLPRGITTGLTKLDEMTGGLRPGELVILAARPSMGKTALAMNIVEHVALKLGLLAVVFSLEMSGESLLQRCFCSVGRVDSQRFRMGFMNQAEREKVRSAAQRLYESGLMIDDKASITVVDIYSRCQRVKAERGRLDLVVVDYLQLITGSGDSESRQQEVSTISRMLKLMSKDLNVPVVAISQLSRGPETRPGDHRPALSDLRESGALEQDADLVGFIFREEVYKRDREDLRGLAELILAKQRNGPVGTVDLVFLNSMTRFENRAEDLGDTV